MSPDVLWNVKGVRREAREQARLAARRSGMSVGEWLNCVIDSAEEAAAPRSAGRGDRSAAPEWRSADADRLADVLTRLDRRLAHLLPQTPASTGTANTAPDARDPGDDADARKRWIEEAAGVDWDADAGSDLGGLAAVEADEAPKTARTSEPDGPPLDLSGLERQLQRITSQIESLKSPSPVDEVTGALRDEIAAIGRTLVDAVPRRTLDALEREVRNLSERLAENQARSGSAEFDGVERALADVRTTIARLVPAETAQALHEAVKALAGKLDELSGADRNTAVLQQIETALAAVRGMLAHVASRDALGELAGELRVLSVRVDRVLAIGNGSNELLRTIDKRITTLAAALEGERRDPAAGHGSAVDAMIAGLGEKIDRLRSADAERGGLDPAAVGRLEQRILALADKLDASESRFNRFATIERGLTELSAQLEDMRSMTAGLPRSDGAAVATAPDAGAQPGTTDPQRAPYGDMIERLASIDAEMRMDSQARRADAPRAGASVAQASAKAPGNAGSPPRPTDPARGTPAESGSAAERIAASRAALGPGAASAGAEAKSDFIAAARRAAQAAAAEREEPAPARAETRNAGRADARPDAQSTGRLMKSLVVGTGVVLVTLGALRFGLYEGGHDTQSAALAPGVPSAAHQHPVRTSASQPPRDVAASRTGADPLLEGAPASGLVTAEPQRLSAASRTGSAPNARPNEVTGSIPPVSPPGTTAARRGMPAKIAPAVGGSLAAAAAAGNPAAAYELATRYAEGRTVAQNLEEAALWFERAAGQGLAPAQFRLGSLYEKGQGVRKDLQEARRLYLAAADKGNAKAMHNLAVLYAEGIDGKPDYQTAIRWFRDAADRGVPDSQYNLGVLFARGIGVERNLSESFKWFTLAAAHGDADAARKRDEVAARLDAPSLAAARSAVQTWRAKPQPEEANSVAAPPGGWDQSSVGVAPAKPARSHVQAAQKTSSL